MSSDEESVPDEDIGELTETDLQSLREAQVEGSYANLLTIHQYLGSLKTVTGYKLFKNDQVIKNMPAIFTNTLVFPGSVLPMSLFVRSSDQHHASEVIKGFRFVLITRPPQLESVVSIRDVRFRYGVVLEVFEASLRDQRLHFKARGRERCLITFTDEVVKLWGHFQAVTVRILCEPTTDSFLAHTDLLSVKSKRAVNETDYDDMMRNYKYRRLHMQQYPFPSFVYDRNELCFYVKHVLRYLRMFYVSNNIPHQPIALSYWFAQNFQLNHAERLQMLACNSALHRLRLALQFIQQVRHMRCKTCKTPVASQCDVFSMSTFGAQINYVNPGGTVFEVLTLFKATNLTLASEPSTHYSWFPGYSWTILQCSVCCRHSGWLFESDRLEPKKFYALACSSLSRHIVQEPGEFTPDAEEGGDRTRSGRTSGQV